MSAAKPRVAVLYNAPTLPPGHSAYASEAGVVAAARAVSAALKARGFKSWTTAARPPIARLFRTLSRRKPDAVFNLIEGFGGHSGGEARVTSLLELMGLPYTGCTPEAQGLCRQKGRAKALLAGSGLPTARWAVLEPGDTPPEDMGTTIVKPESEDASLGIDQGSVVTTVEGMLRRVEQARSAHGPRILVESYLPGPEYNVGVLVLPDPSALPIAEVVYDVAPGAWPILTYEAKWHVGSAEDLASPVRCPIELDEALARELSGLAIAAFRATGCRDVARVDFRLDAEGRPMILEVNPNPDLDPSAGWARALRASGRDWGETMVALARQAIERGPRHD